MIDTYLASSLFGSIIRPICKNLKRSDNFRFTLIGVPNWTAVSGLHWLTFLSRTCWLTHALQKESIKYKWHWRWHQLWKNTSTQAKLRNVNCPFWKGGFLSLWLSVSHTHSWSPSLPLRCLRIARSNYSATLGKDTAVLSCYTVSTVTTCLMNGQDWTESQHSSERRNMNAAVCQPFVLILSIIE